MSNLQEQAKSVFDQALEIESDTEQRQFLENRYQENPAVRKSVEALLRARGEAGSFLEKPPLNLPETTLRSIRKHHGTIGPYKLLHLLGEGGMGSVFLAEQKKPVRRRVAVKIIKQGLNSQQFVARFEAERQALAMMEHPNIAKVLDAGCTEDGLPYFVMEYVKGVPITTFCDENRLTTRDRLELFVHVCQAVQHAHQKGVIHRDLKPSNVMVAMHDDHPVPMVIDFGVAKATHQPLTEHTLCTVPGQIVGTWEYMSPEQAILNQLDVDTRTDVYSLGVMLYELLTGQTPLELSALDPGELEERLRRIREHEPARPSLRISSLGKAASAAAVYRKAELHTWAQSISGDLDWIVMKALEKDRGQRYESASGFAGEINRYLNDEPLSIRPPSRWERMSRFYRRNKGLVIAASAIMLTILVAFIFVFAALRSKTKALETLCTRLIRDGIENALSEDKRAFQETLALGEYAEMPEDWRLTLLGAEALHTGDNPESQRFLEQAKLINPGNVAAKSMLAIAYFHDGRREQWLRLMSEFDSWEPRAEYEDLDRLFLAYARLYSDYEGAASELEEILEENPTWFLARVLLAIAYAESAQDRGEEENAHKALEKIEIPLKLYPDNPFVLAVGAFVHEVALRMIDEPTVLVRERASAIALRLKPYNDYHVGVMMIAGHYDLAGNRPQALEAWQNLFNNGRSFFQSRAMAEYYREGNDNLILDLEPEEDDSEAKIARAFVLALTPERREEAVEIFESEVESAKTTIVRYQLLQLGLLLRIPSDDLEDQCGAWARAETGGSILYEDDIHRRSIEFVLGERSSLEPSTDHEYERFQVNYIKALLAYSRDDPAEAMRLLNLCNQSRGQSTEHHWARAFYARWKESPQTPEQVAGVAP